MTHCTASSIPTASHHANTILFRRFYPSLLVYDHSPSLMLGEKIANSPCSWISLLEIELGRETAEGMEMEKRSSENSESVGDGMGVSRI